MDILDKSNHLTMAVFNCSVKEFIEKGVKKGRHYFYLRDALGLTNKKFLKLLGILGIDAEKVKATKQDFYALFIQPETEEDPTEDEEMEVYA